MEGFLEQIVDMGVDDFEVFGEKLEELDTLLQGSRFRSTGGEDIIGKMKELVGSDFDPYKDLQSQHFAFEQQAGIDPFESASKPLKTHVQDFYNDASRAYENAVDERASAGIYDEPPKLSPVLNPNASPELVELVALTRAGEEAGAELADEFGQEMIDQFAKYDDMFALPETEPEIPKIEIPEPQVDELGIQESQKTGPSLARFEEQSQGVFRGELDEVLKGEQIGGDLTDLTMRNAWEEYLDRTGQTSTEVSYEKFVANSKLYNPEYTYRLTPVPEELMDSSASSSTAFTPLGQSELDANKAFRTELESSGLSRRTAARQWVGDLYSGKWERTSGTAYAEQGTEMVSLNSIEPELGDAVEGYKGHPFDGIVDAEAYGAAQPEGIQNQAQKWWNNFVPETTKSKILLGFGIGIPTAGLITWLFIDSLSEKIPDLQPPNPNDPSVQQLEPILEEEEEEIVELADTTGFPALTGEEEEEEVVEEASISWFPDLWGTSIPPITDSPETESSGTSSSTGGGGMLLILLIFMFMMFLK